jgi:CheY-like chemotaxis protein
MDPKSMAARVLIVGADAAALELMLYLLESSGHSARAAARFEDAIAMAVVEVPDLIVCDMHGVGPGGPEALRRLREEPGLARVPIVPVSRPIDAATFMAQLEPFLRKD